MSKLLMVPALALGVAATAGLATASDDDYGPRVHVPKGQWMSVAQIAERLGAQGYNIREIELEHGAYEVSVYAENGRRMEIYVHPATGEILPGKPRH